MLKQLLNSGKTDLLNIYCTAGYPQLDDLLTVIRSLEKAGVDMVEIGIPFSDPLADGPTIQQSNAEALENGITLELIFEQLGSVKTNIPKIMMGYLNPVFQFGMERFCQKCQEVGIAGIILPDLPPKLFEARYQKLFAQYGLSMIFLITPETSLERIKLIDRLSSSFIYAVSRSGTTGTDAHIQSPREYLEGLKHLPVRHPILVGFNIAQPEDLELVCRHARGGIIGSAFIKHLRGRPDIEQACIEFVEHIKQTSTT